MTDNSNHASYEEQFSVSADLFRPPDTEETIDGKRVTGESPTQKPVIETGNSMHSAKNDSPLPQANNSDESSFTERKIVTLRDLLHILFKHMWFILVTTCVCVVLAIIYAYTVTPEYRADTKLLVMLGKEKFSDMQSYSQNISVLIQERNQNINNELQILKSEALSLQVFPILKNRYNKSLGNARMLSPSWITTQIKSIKSRFSKTHLTPDDILRIKFQNSMRIEFLAETDIVEISFKWYDPDFASFAANTYAEEYVNLRTTVHRSKKSHAFYVKQTNLLRAQVDKILADEKKYSEQWNVVEINLEKDLLLRSKDVLLQKYNVQRIGDQQIGNIRNQLKRMYKEPDTWVETPTTYDNTMIDRQSYLQDLDRQYFTLKLDRARLLKKFTKKSREVKNINVFLQKIKTQKYNSLINILHSAHSISGATLADMKKELNTIEERLPQLIKATYVLEELNLKKEIAKNNLRQYMQKAEQLRIFEDLDQDNISNIKVMTIATPPLRPVFPKKNIIILTAAFLGLFVSFGFSAIVEFFTHIFRNDQDVESILGIPVLMSIKNTKL